MKKAILTFLAIPIFLFGMTSCNNTNEQTSIDRVDITKNQNNEISLTSDDAKGYLKRGQARFELGDDTDAIQDYNRAIQLEPDNARAYYLRGVAKSALDENLGDVPEVPSRDYTGSIRKLNDAVKVDITNDPESYDSNGLGKFELGDDKGALRDFNRTIELDPDFAEAYYARGLEKEKLGNDDGALEDLRKAGELGCSKASEQIRRIQSGDFDCR